MRRVVGILSTAMVPVFVAGMALAADPMGTVREHVPGMGKSESESGTHGTKSGGTMSEHQMSGTVKSIDKDAGTLSFESTDGKKMELHFPRTALQNINEGDRVTIQLAIRPASGASSGATSGSGARGSGSESGSGSRSGSGMGGTGGSGSR